MPGKTREYHCSFCGKSQDQVRRMIAGPNHVYICNECVSLCNQIIAEETSPRDTTHDAGGGWRATKTDGDNGP